MNCNLKSGGITVVKQSFVDRFQCPILLEKCDVFHEESTGLARPEINQDFDDHFILIPFKSRQVSTS
jgi:hypothetical protein